MASKNLFDIPIHVLPRIIPVLPFSQALLLPNEMLPLNIFELRYIELVLDALREKRMVGILHETEKGGWYETGCVGRIVAFEEQENERFTIVLRGICRFKVVEEMPTISNYRRLRVDYDDFDRDYNLNQDTLPHSAERILQELATYLEMQNIRADWSRLQDLPAHRLVNFLSIHLPFGVKEKQSLLNAESNQERSHLLTALAELSVQRKHGGHSLN
jgi:uncharacterized protein